MSSRVPALVQAEPSAVREAEASEQRRRKLPVLSVARLLEAQRTLTAVERFSEKHEVGDLPAKAKYYRDLIPLARPRPGEQYAFQVDLDACTGCKACVSACHTLNGLADGETWRAVGLLHGGTADAPARQLVTTACHHCLEPGCLQGCPTQAYEKDPVTGVVKHLDDQCFGCQYCTLMCPYDAPKYNAAFGIVRKCDMCSDRLAHGEAPACVQGCPNGAIAITVVAQREIAADGSAGSFLPGAPTPEHTLPATRYRSARGLPEGLEPADYHRVRVEHSHPPLVVMLTLTQLSVGALAFGYFVPEGLPQALFASCVALVGLLASVFHLGRPLYAFRAVLGLRTSWLSREAVAFGLYAQLLLAYAALVAAPQLPLPLALPEWLPRVAAPLRAAALLAGIAAVFCSAMVYVATRRPHWALAYTASRFYGTAFVLGAAGVFAVSSFGAAPARGLLPVVVAGAAFKLAFELRGLRRARDAAMTAHKRMALALLGPLRPVTTARFALLGLGGVLLPLALAFLAVDPLALRACAVTLLSALTAGELLERYGFFSAAPGSRMPGALP